MKKIEEIKKEALDIFKKALETTLREEYAKRMALEAEIEWLKTLSPDEELGERDKIIGGRQLKVKITPKEAIEELSKELKASERVINKIETFIKKGLKEED